MVGLEANWIILKCLKLKISMALKVSPKKSYKINSSFALNNIGRNNNEFVWGNMAEIQNVFLS
jgi:hypothetical protein